jgi:hypothetical protein
MSGDNKAWTIVFSAIMLGLVACIFIMAQCSIAVSNNNGAACIRQGGHWVGSTDPAEAGGSCQIPEPAKR